MYAKSVFTFLRESLKEYRKANESLPKKIYVSRNDVNTRNVKNESELVMFLEGIGYQKIVLSDYDVSDQVSLFANATHLITPHGAALTNTLYSDNLNIIELFPENRGVDYTYHFYQISSYFGHHHKLVMCKCDKNVFCFDSRNQRTPEQKHNCGEFGMF